MAACFAAVQCVEFLYLAAPDRGAACISLRARIRAWLGSGCCALTGLGSAAVLVVLEVLLGALCVALGKLQRVILSELQHFLHTRPLAKHLSCSIQPGWCCCTSSMTSSSGTSPVLGVHSSGCRAIHVVSVHSGCCEALPLLLNPALESLMSVWLDCMDGWRCHHLDSLQEATFLLALSAKHPSPRGRGLGIPGSIPVMSALGLHACVVRSGMTS